ncbi:hypothetical protein F2Q70_00035916 [Brassica cretica]|uniref:Uncharacterized protein n=1 Tax=Brassica cretica TaxID=69181 RepID=A0A8S9JT59_BRACR|nr:hypothetical protein F2Q70_00035916 [Brassica cretica]
MPRIEVARLNVLRPQPKPSAKPPETTSTHSDDAAEPMEVDKAPMGRTLRKRKGKITKHLKREANEKEMEIFQKGVFRIPLEKSFEEAYFTHKLWIFFRETKETEEDIMMMFYEAREEMKNKITLKKKSDPGKFAIPCTVKGIEFPHALCDTRASDSILPRVMADHMGLKVESSKESFTFVDCSQRSSGGLVRDLEESLLVNSRSNVQHPNQPVVLDAHRPASEYETEYSTSIETHTVASVDNTPQISIDIHKEESIDSSPGDWKNDYYNPTKAVHTAIPTKDTLYTKEYDEDYEEERAIETVPTSFDTLLHQISCNRASPDIAYYPSIDTGVDRARQGDYSIGIWADDNYHERFAVETSISQPRADELH